MRLFCRGGDCNDITSGIVLGWGSIGPEVSCALIKSRWQEQVSRLAGGQLASQSDMITLGHHQPRSTGSSQASKGGQSLCFSLFVRSSEHLGTSAWFISEHLDACRRWLNPLMLLFCCLSSLNRQSEWSVVNLSTVKLVAVWDVYHELTMWFLQ